MRLSQLIEGLVCITSQLVPLQSQTVGMPPLGCRWRAGTGRRRGEAFGLGRVELRTARGAIVVVSVNISSTRSTRSPSCQFAMAAVICSRITAT